MKDLIIILLLLTLTLTLHHQHSDPVKVLLYPYLPSTGNKTAEYQNLVELLNKKLKDSNINVHVTLNKKECDFYNLTSLAGCFDKYDVIQVDISLLASVQKIIQDKGNFEFLKWTQQQLNDYFDKVYQFQWQPSKRVNKQTNQTFYIASPGLMCSDFIESLKNRGKTSIQFMQKAFDGYSYPSLYAQYYLNKYQDKNLDTMNYTIDDQVFDEFQKFFLQCQSTQQFTYNFSDNYCTNPNLNGGFQSNKTNSLKTTGYSEYLFDFWKVFEGDFKPYKHQSHIMGDKLIRSVYLDQFVAKDPKNNDKRSTILAFNKFMISDDVLDIYTKGSYLNRNSQHQWSNYTYLLPPARQYFQKLSQSSDQNYKNLYQIFNFENKAKYFPVYGEIYFNNSSKLTNDIMQRLQN